MRKSYWDAGIKDATCYSWRTELGGLKRSRARLLKDLEREKRVTGKGPNNILIGDSSHKFDPCSLQGSSNIAV